MILRKVSSILSNGIDSLYTAWVSFRYEVRRFFYFYFKRLKWFLRIKESPLIKVEVNEVPSEMLGGIEGMLVAMWYRKSNETGAFQMHESELDYLLSSPKKHTFSNLPPDVEAYLKNNCPPPS
tara:strand:+ start:185 stop:553 length:369 start_codon:yes stop_codon:yes gene_type:complete